MKLVYVANARLPTEKAHGLQIMRACEAFARIGLEVELVHPFRHQSPAMERVNDIWAYYGVADRFTLTQLAVPDLIALKLPGQLKFVLFVLQSVWFASQATRYIAQRRPQSVYTRDHYTALILGSMRDYPYVYEAHDYFDTSVGRWVQQRACRLASAVVTNTSALRERFITQGLNPDRILVARNGVDVELFRAERDREMARAKLDVAASDKLVLYTGHLYKWKGVLTLVEAAAHLPGQFVVCLVGGMNEDIERFRQIVKERGLSKVKVVGHVAPAEVPDYTTAADVLVVPNTARDRYSLELTCPIKVFEYMASGHPIVASNLPSIREVLRDGESAVLVPPDDPAELAAGILRVVEDRTLAERLTQSALEDVRRYSWVARARRIARFVWSNTSEADQ
jgi:glycosyltransferase involved in cell wall biosynthesis